MILILGGTTEGRAAARVLDEAGRAFLYSTRGDEQVVSTKNGILIQGAKDADSITTLIIEKDVRLVVDAAHPFATALHHNVIGAASAIGVPVVRYERIYPPDSPHIVYCSSISDAIDRLRTDNIHRLLALTGVQTIEPFRPYWSVEPLCRFRILDRDSSRSIAQRAGFPLDRLEYFEDSEGADYRLMERIMPGAIITKESGLSGFFEQKIEAASALGIRIYVLRRPSLPDGYRATVDGEAGLRRIVQQFVPDFFAQRTGLTTGAAATAAAKAALLTIITEEAPSEVWISLPKTGEHVMLPIANTTYDGRCATCIVIKDGGDDPDATHGTEICATVSLPDIDARTPAIYIDGGIGVGRITLPGFDLPIGAAAINTTPRRMIEAELSALLPHRPIDVVISVPQGAEIAPRTFNPRLGIAGGISIIGTTGVVRPFSSDAFVGSIRRSIQVAKAVGVDCVVINSGGKSEHRMQQWYSELPLQSFVQYGNFIGQTLAILNELQVPRIVMGIMIGKAVKLAEGVLDTHSHKGTMNKEFLCKLAKSVGCSSEGIATIGTIVLARELLVELSDRDQGLFLDAILCCCYDVCRPLVPDADLTIRLVV